MYVCTELRMWVCTYVRTYVYLGTELHTRCIMYRFSSVYIRTYRVVCMCVYAQSYVCMCVYAQRYVRMYVCICTEVCM